MEFASAHRFIDNIAPDGALKGLCPLRIPRIQTKMMIETKTRGLKKERENSAFFHYFLNDSF